MRAVLLAAALLLAGCIGQPAGEQAGNPGVPTPEATPPTPEPTTPIPPDPNATAEESVPVAFREVAVGTFSALPFPMRLVFTEQEEWASFWREHEGGGYQGENMTPPATSEPPAVDFAAERVVVVMTGEMPNTCWAVRVTNAMQWEGVTTLTVTTYGPGPEDMCGDAMTQPFAIIALPNDGSEVAYRDEEVAGRPPGAG